MELQTRNAFLLRKFEEIMPKETEAQKNESLRYPPQMFIGLEIAPDVPLFSLSKIADDIKRFEDEAGHVNATYARELQEIYELGSLMLDIGIAATYNWLLKVIAPKKLEMRERGEEELYSIIIFESPQLEEWAKREKEALALQTDTGTLTDTRECNKCGNQQVFVRVVQDRKADEGPSTVFTCPKCNACWKEG